MQKLISFIKRTTYLSHIKNSYKSIRAQLYKYILIRGSICMFRYILCLFCNGKIFETIWSIKIGLAIVTFCWWVYTLIWLLWKAIWQYLPNCKLIYTSTQQPHFEGIVLQIHLHDYCKTVILCRIICNNKRLGTTHTSINRGLVREHAQCNVMRKPVKNGEALSEQTDKDPQDILSEKEMCREMSKYDIFLC